MIKINDRTTITNMKSYTISFCCILLMVFSTTIAQTSDEQISVDAIIPKQVENYKKIELIGSVEAKQQAQLGTLEAGRIETLSFEIGDIVTFGQSLLTLNSQLPKLEVLRASTEVKVAEINVKESERLFKEAQKLSEQKVVAKTLKAERAAMVSSAKAQLEKANATLHLQQEILNRHTLKAPFDGVITQRNVDVGEWVTQQTDVLTLVAQNDLRLTIAVPQQYYNQIKSLSDVAVNVIPDSKNRQSFSAKLSRIVPVSNETTRTFLAQIDIPSDVGLVPGMSANAEISLPESQQSKIVLPRSALKQHPDGGSSVFIVDNNRAKRVLTNYIVMPNDKIAIFNQPINQAYIISGVELLQDGSPIKTNIIDANKKSQ